MKRLPVLSIAFSAVAVLLPALQPLQAHGSQQIHASKDVQDNSMANDYCLSDGGQVQNRQPYYNTNDSNQKN